jgi:ABC-type Mn2+/Zn2+ transport system ATPase subunit
VLFENLSFNLPPGGIVGVIGPNGAGKTTLFRILAGQERPDGGELHIGETVQMAYVDQSRDSLDASKTVWEEISDGLDAIAVGRYEVPSRAYLGRFNFKGPDQQKRVGDLSGGERNRVHLAKLLKSGGNLLLLDEPTNDLDVETLRALEEALLVFPGCAVVISHDRWFLDRIATHILAFEGDSRLRGGPPPPPWSRSGSAAPHQVSAADALTMDRHAWVPRRDGLAWARSGSPSARGAHAVEAQATPKRVAAPTVVPSSGTCDVLPRVAREPLAGSRLFL